MNRVLMVVLCSFSFISLFWTVTGWLNPSQKVVSVDMAHIKGQFIEQLARHAASPETVTKASTRFNHSLTVVLAQYSKKTHAVILDRQFILLGAQDVTDDIKPLLAAAMRGTS